MLTMTKPGTTYLEPTTPLGKRLLKVRKKHGLTQKQAADLAGISLRSWISWERGEAKPSKMGQRQLDSFFDSHK